MRPLEMILLKNHRPIDISIDREMSQDLRRFENFHKTLNLTSFPRHCDDIERRP